LEQLGVELAPVRERVVATIGISGSAPTGSPPFTPRAKKVLEMSLREALQLGHNYIGTEHILLGILAEGEGVGAQVLVSFGADLPKVRHQVSRILETYPRSEGESTPRFAGIARRFPPRGPDPAASSELVGKNRIWRVVRPGRKPADYAQAYEDLSELVVRDGIELDDVEPGQISVMSVETNEGPGLAVSISQTAQEERDENDVDAGGSE
jgi:hypothetical protein